MRRLLRHGTALGIFMVSLGAGAGPACAQASQSALAQVFPVHAAIDATKASRPVSRYEYGMFIEPIGRAIDRSLWAEMLDDRKFFFPVLPEGQDAPPKRASFTGPDRHWRPVGPAEGVIMDRMNPFVGEQSVRIALAPESPRGVSQSGLGVIGGKTYTGRVVVSVPAGAHVSVSLVWGAAPGDRQAVRLPATGSGWKTVPLKFTAGATAGTARLEITGTGQGSFRVGAVSLMPADNMDGWRADAIRELRTLKSGMWRLPGGNYLSNWDWHDAIGPRDQRRPMYDHSWSAMQTNDIGMDEYMKLCELIGTEPYVTVNAGLGDANSAAEEVEYLNGPATSYWGGKRARNGHAAPYGIRYWNIGNEPYGDWQIGKTSLEYYTIKHIDFAQRMKRVDPSITLLASGAMPDQRKWPGVEKENANLQSILPKFGTELDWTGGLIANAADYFDGITEHWYDTAEKRPDAPPEDELLEFARQPSNNVRMKAEEWKIYRSKYSSIDRKDLFLSIDEYAYFPAAPNLKTSLAYAMVMQEMLRHTDAIRMSAFTMGSSTMDVTPTDATINSTGVVFQLYGQHFGEGVIPLDVTGDTPWPAPRYPVGLDHPQVVAGSPTWPLDVVAALSPDRRKVIVGVVNATTAERPLVLDLKGMKIRGGGKMYRLGGAGLEAANGVGKAPGVSIVSSDAGLADGSLSVPAISAVVYEFEVAGE